MSTATCVIMKEVFRQGIQCAIVFPSNVKGNITCYFFIWSVFHVFVSFCGFGNFFCNLSTVPGFCLCFYFFSLKIFHSTTVMLSQSFLYIYQLFFALNFDSRFLLLLFPLLRFKSFMKMKICMAFHFPNSILQRFTDPVKFGNPK